MKNFACYLIIAALAEIASLVIIFGIAHFSSHNLSPASAQLLASCDLVFSKNPLKPGEYKTDRAEAERSLAELSILSTALGNGTGFLLAIPIISVLISFSLDARKKGQIKKADQIEVAPDTGLVFSEGTAKLLFFFCLSLPVLLLAGCCVIGKGWTGDTTLWIFSQSFSLIEYFWPVTALVLAGLIYTRRRASTYFRWRYMLAFVPFVPAMLSVVWGGFWYSVSGSPLFTYDGGGCQRKILECIFWSFFPLAFLALYAHKEHRLFCVAVVVCEFWFLLCSNFTAAEAVTGTWL